MRHTLRQMIDGGDLACAMPMPPVAKPQPNPDLRQQALDPKPRTNNLPMNTPQTGVGSKKAGTALAKHVATNLEDPLGSTKEGFDELNDKKMQYDMARQKMMRNLAPVQSVIDHVSKMHDLNENGIPDELEPGMGGQDQAEGYHGPNSGDRSGVPANMAQQPGRMQQNAPGKTVSYPGAGPKIPGAPARQANPEAPAAKAAPKGQQSSKTMKPGKQSPRNIKVSVKASDGIARGVSERIRSTYAAAQLANMSCCDMTEPLKKTKMEARDFSDTRREKLAKQHKAMPGGGFPIVNDEDLDNAKRAIGRAKNPAKARAWVNKRAGQLGEPKIGETKKDMKSCRDC